MGDFNVNITLYHNPRCSKSRTALALLKENQCEIEVIEYLKTPPNTATLRSIVDKLGTSARDLVRTSEPEYKSLNLANANEARLIKAITQHPKLMQRPIVVSENKAIIGRPPDAILEIL
ncbi:MAG: arsenate reductase (glutaredoxin) [Acidiferrobacteraceae bacterium]|nr:arsenate reductase (glutaredoxin) [Acidiferrobacteraceae bacterium]